MTRNKPLVLFVLLLLLVLIKPAAAEIYAEIMMDSSHTETIQLYRDQNRWILFLPSGVSLHDVSFPAQDTPVEIIGDELAYGNNAIKINKKQVKLYIMQSRNLISVFIDTDRYTLTQFGKNKTMLDTGSCRIFDSSARPLVDDQLTEFKLHGNSSLHPEKRSYKIKFENKQAIASMEKDRTWLLIANTFDNSYTRNFIAHELAEKLGVRFDPDYVAADLYVNRDYRGTYTLSEKIQVGKGRVEIADLEAATENINALPLNSYAVVGEKRIRRGQGKYYKIENDPEDITGGYLLELTMDNRYADADSAYVTTRGQIVRIRAPKYISEKQFNYISQLIQSAENAFFSEDGTDPATGKRLEEIVDLDSLVCKYMLEEIMSNYDGNKASQYFFKPSDSQDTRLIWGPAWDYDLSLGNRYEEDISFVQADALSVVGDRALHRTTWFTALYTKQPVFRQRLKELFTALDVRAAVSSLLDGGEDSAHSIDAWSRTIEASLTMNFTRWHFVTFIRQIKRLTTVPEQIEYVKNFLGKRILFLEKEWLVYGQQ